MAVLPLATSFFMVALFSAQIMQHIPIGVLKQDDSKLADELIFNLSADPVLRVAKNCITFDDCEHAMIRGEVQAFVVLPNGLERKAFRLETPVVPIYSNGQYYLSNTFAAKEIRSVFSAVGSKIFTGNVADPVKTEIHSVGNLEGNYQGFLGLGVVTAIFHLSAILIAVYVFSFPFRDRRVREYLEAAGGSRMILWLASVIPMVLIQWLLMLGVYSYTHKFLNSMTFQEFVMVAAGQLAMVIACTGIGTMFVGVTGNMRMASSAAGVIGGPAFAFAGQSFPVMAMPFAVRCFAYLLPLTHVLLAQSSMLVGDYGAIEAWKSIRVLLVMGLLWHMIGCRLMFMRWKRRAIKEKLALETSTEVDDAD